MPVEVSPQDACSGDHDTASGANDSYHLSRRTLKMAWHRTPEKLEVVWRFPMSPTVVGGGNQCTNIIDKGWRRPYYQNTEGKGGRYAENRSESGVEKLRAIRKVWRKTVGHADSSGEQGGRSG